MGLELGKGGWVCVCVCVASMKGNPVSTEGIGGRVVHSLDGGKMGPSELFSL